MEQELKPMSAEHELLFEKELLPQADALYNFAYHLTYDAEDANDLVQDAYLKAMRFMDKYSVGTNPKAWLFTILKNAFINEYRKKSRQPNRVDYEEVVNFHQEEEGTNYSTYMDLRVELFENMMGDEVSNAVNSLPEDFRTVILLCDLEGFSYEEIAEILDVPIGTVRSRLHRARNTLKESLRNYAESMGFENKRKDKEVKPPKPEKKAKRPRI
jgi:RNA polymerase sigma factor (sigma-70 family)